MPTPIYINGKGDLVRDGGNLPAASAVVDTVYHNLTTNERNAAVAGTYGDQVKERVLAIEAQALSASAVAAVSNIVASPTVVSTSRTALATDSGTTLGLQSGVTYTLSDAVSLPAGVTLMGPSSGTATIAVTGAASMNGSTTAITISAYQVYAVLPGPVTPSSFRVKGS